MTDRQGIEIDYCPQCRGVWLDRGELDKIIERTATEAPPAAAPPAPDPRRDDLRRDDSRRDDVRRDDRPVYRDYDDDDYKRKRKKGLLGELFDF